MRNTLLLYRFSLIELRITSLPYKRHENYANQATHFCNMSTISTILDAELADCVRNNAVTQLHIVQQPNKKFIVKVALTWKEGLTTLVKQRKDVREWASVDRLVAHIQVNYGVVPLITIEPLTVEALNPPRA